MHALAGRVKESSKLKLYGERYINGRPVSGDSMVPSAVVEQEVNFFPYMTVRETLAFRVDLKLGSRMSKKRRDELVEELISEVRLQSSADTIVGDSKVRGISGGERRRLSIACELISSPNLIFLDEPTSGTLLCLILSRVPLRSTTMHCSTIAYAYAQYASVHIHAVLLQQPFSLPIFKVWIVPLPLAWWRLSVGLPTRVRPLWPSFISPVNTCLQLSMTCYCCRRESRCTLAKFRK